MVKNKLSMIFGILFGICLLPFAYFCFVLSIVLAISKGIDFAVMIYIFPVLAIITIVGACIINKAIIATRIIFSITLATYIGSIIFLATTGIFADNFIFVLIFSVFAVIGILATIFAYLAKPKQKISL